MSDRSPKTRPDCGWVDRETCSHCGLHRSDPRTGLLRAVFQCRARGDLCLQCWAFALPPCEGCPYKEAPSR